MWCSLCGPVMLRIYKRYDYGLPKPIMFFANTKYILINILFIRQWPFVGLNKTIKANIYRLDRNCVNMPA